MHPLTQKIAALHTRLLWRQRLTAACWVLATAIVAAILLGLTDYWLHFKDTGLRIMATTAFALAISWVAYRTWYLPAWNRLQALDVACRVESHFPQLQDSLASAIEFLGQSEHDELAGSAQLRRLVVAEAQNTVETLPLEEVIERRPLRWAAGSLVTGLVVALICFAMNSSAARTALVRLMAPLGTTQWPRQNHLQFRNVPTRLAAGQTLEVELVDPTGSLPDDVRFEFGVAGEGGREVTYEPMTRVGEMLTARRENVQRSFGFRAAGGDDDTMPWNWVEVVEPPKLESLSLEVQPPTYTGLPASKAERHLEVLAGTGIEASGTTSKPIKAATILQDGVLPITATIAADPAGNDRRAFHISAGQWIAAKTGPYRLELVDDDGVAGIVGQWNLRVEPDPSPSVSWQQPSEDMFVLPGAVAPLAVLVKDNLAIKQIGITYERSDQSAPGGSERKDHPAEPMITIYRGPEHPGAGNHPLAGRGDTQIAKYDWELAPLNLSAGAKLMIQAEAQDYRPGVGKAAAPRKVSIITVDELEARLADRQSQIVRQLERALAIEQATREDVRRLEIQVHDAGTLAPADRNTLQSTELNQRRAGRMLVDLTEGVVPLVDSIVAEIDINRLENSATRDTMERVSAELKRLATETLSTAERELTAARKAVEIQRAPDAKPADGLGQSLTTAATAQEDVIATLERLISELSGKADVRRFARLLAELRQDQLTHEKSARAEIGLETLPLAANELTRSQRASLNKAAAGENSIAGRFDKIEQGLDQLAQQLTKDGDPTAGTVDDAVALSRQLSIALDMRQSTGDLRDNRVGQALQRESQISENLQKVLSALRNETERKPEQLVDKLREAEKRLAALREQTAALRQQTASAETKPAAANDQARSQLAAQQQKTRDEIEKLARELDRLQAPEAGKFTQSAAKQLDNRDSNGKQPNPAGQKPSSSSQVQKSEQDLKQAAEQLAQRRKQAEDDLALEFVRRFQTDLAQMVERQTRVLAKTGELDAVRKDAATLTPDQATQTEKLATEERQLADLAKEHSELLAGLEAVRISLEESERRLLAAGKLLDDHQTGSPAQAAEKKALDRLAGMLEAFAQTAQEAAPKPNPPPPPAGQQNAPPPQRRPTFELLQAKMLRMLQGDLNERTRDCQERLTVANAAEKLQIEQEVRELAVEQGRLAELVQKMLSHDNEFKQEPPK